MVIFLAMLPKFLAEEMQPIMFEPHVHQLVLLLPASTRLFFLSTSFYRVRDSAPDGSSPQDYSRNFWV
jgi:hypothetical protein